MSPADEVVRVTAVVAADPALAFSLFTEEVDAWWRREPRYRLEAGEELAFEPRVGGRLLARGPSGATRELARVRHWEPAVRLVLTWLGPPVAPGPATEVEVRFEAAAGGTRVTLEHRGWDAVAPDHSARHGLTGSAFTALMGSWWGDLLLALGRLAGRRNG